MVQAQVESTKNPEWYKSLQAQVTRTSANEFVIKGPEGTVLKLTIPAREIRRLKGMRPTQRDAYIARRYTPLIHEALFKAQLEQDLRPSRRLPMPKPRRPPPGETIPTPSSDAGRRAAPAAAAGAKAAKPPASADLTRTYAAGGERPMGETRSGKEALAAREAEAGKAGEQARATFKTTFPIEGGRAISVVVATDTLKGKSDLQIQRLFIAALIDSGVSEREAKLAVRMNWKGVKKDIDRTIQEAKNQ